MVASPKLECVSCGHEMTQHDHLERCDLCECGHDEWPEEDDLADALTPDEVWSEGGIKD
jgi:Zn ribbon nucleic-acid-binding protein